MQTVAQTTTARKAPKAFYAHLYDTSGVLAKVDGEILFFGDDGSIVEIEPSMCNFLTVLGEVGVSDTQALMDKLHGGHAAVACSRAQEVL